MFLSVFVYRLIIELSFLEPLLDSIYNQDYCLKNNDFEIIVCEDKSPQRDEINSIIENYKAKK